MHPILGQLRRLIPYLLGWLPLAGMLVYLLAVPGGLTWIEAFALGVPLCLLYGFMCLSAWYSCRWTPLERIGALQLALTHLLAATVVSGFWILSAKALGHVLSDFSAFSGLEPRLSKNLSLLFGTGILLYFLAVAFFYVLLAVQQSQEAKEREMKAGVLARDAELRALKAQVNPHFLFNSLNLQNGRNLSRHVNAQSSQSCCQYPALFKYSGCKGVCPVITDRRMIRQKKMIG
jgi:two-component system sensor histidine kinase AlgZ